MTIDIYLVYDVEEAEVVGVYSSYDKARALIEEHIQLGCDPEEFLIYKPPIDKLYVIGSDLKYIVPFQTPNNP